MQGGRGPGALPCHTVGRRLGSRRSACSVGVLGRICSRLSDRLVMWRVCELSPWQGVACRGVPRVGRSYLAQPGLIGLNRAGQLLPYG